MANGGFDPHPHTEPQLGHAFEAQIPPPASVHGPSP